MRNHSISLFTKDSRTLRQELGESLSNTRMKVIGEIRRERLAMLMAETGMSFADISDKIGRSRRDSTLSQIANAAPDSKTKKPRQMGDAQARQLEQQFGKLPGWMDRDPDHDQCAKQLADAREEVKQLQAAERPGVYQLWPFPRLSLERLRALPPDELRRVESSILGFVRDFEEQHPDSGNAAAA